jgi:predicted deacylase
MLGRGGAFEVMECAGRDRGPTVALLGGVHGDEDEGVLAVQRVIANLREHPLRSGTLRAVAVANPAAYAAGTRTNPLDDVPASVRSSTGVEAEREPGNLARAFPGDPSGSATERLAHALLEDVIKGSDLLIDLHSAGVAYAMPTFVGYTDDDDVVGARSRRAAVAFGVPLVWEHPMPVPPGRTISAAIELGIPSIYVEGSGGGSLEHDELELITDGLLNVLADLGMTGWSPPPRPGPRWLVRGSGDLDKGMLAPCGGRFVAHQRPGAVVSGGELIGTIVDEEGATAAELVAPDNATLMLLRRSARIAAGEKVCGLGSPAVAWTGE